MGDWGFFGRILIYMGLVLVFLGLVIWGISRIFPIGRLPGDIFFQKEGFTVYFPLATSLLLSIILSLLLHLLRR